ncbi:MAG: hypothetical protein JKX79_10310 [Labilibaculum sp.]|nr:hypothetical protein [Labilibaculum sp.]
MCKSRIEKVAGEMEGVPEANRNKETQVRIELKQPWQNQAMRANLVAYNVLPNCCRYKRESVRKGCCKE